ncbi:hypothetical protein F5Y17DRAFT_380452 [Xylariaceae sp. FL0594]|nr:hypothetical protein F5Y17DRAFT_380452 [Xylariaceae sp. FL0594]
MLDEENLTTTNLDDALRRWQAFIMAAPDRELRMGRAQEVLRHARRIVRKNCSYNNLRKYAKSRVSTNVYYMRSTVPLSIMVLGETISTVKAQILKAMGSHFGSWHHDDGEGWGEPSWALERLESEAWCPRTKHLWRRQHQDNATLLLASYTAYKGYLGDRGIQRHHGPKHLETCIEEACSNTAEGPNGEYQCAHSPKCPQDHCSAMCGPDMAPVRRILDRPNPGIPLLRFKKNRGAGDRLEVVEWGGDNSNGNPDDSTGPDYVTISHVWADGFGNTGENKILRCQLDYIESLLSRLGFASTPPFWIDTLLVPVPKSKPENDAEKDANRETKRLRKIALSQISKVFIKAKCSLVLDMRLMHAAPGQKKAPAKAAMMIIPSGWMSRIWTLQEAFLSKDIYFAFNLDETAPGHTLIEFSELSTRLMHYAREGGSAGVSLLRVALLTKVNESMRNSIIDHERRKRKYITNEWTDFSQKSCAMMLAHVLKAVMWRMTANPLHEVLALITLFNLEYVADDRIAEAGLAHAPKSLGDQEKQRQREKAAELMVDIWTNIETHFPGSIHPGFIFVSPNRLERPGFGWAPTTWLTEKSLLPPDPLGTITATATLDLVNFHGLPPGNAK